jgi:hypothetical protein
MIRTNPLISLNSIPEMQQIAANIRGTCRNSLRTGKFSRFNRECRPAEKQAHGRITAVASIGAVPLRRHSVRAILEYVFFVCSRQGSASLSGASV